MDNGNGIDQQEAEQEKDTHTDDNDYGDADDGTFETLPSLAS